MLNNRDGQRKGHGPENMKGIKNFFCPIYPRKREIYSCLLILEVSGSYIAADSCPIESGSPRYRIGIEPVGKFLIFWM